LKSLKSSRSVAAAKPAGKASVLKMLRSPALGSALTFALGGAGFALGNILLARVLPPEEYGAVALFLALTQLGTEVGPLGLELIINRRRLVATYTILGKAVLTSAFAGIVFALYALGVYAMSATLSAVLTVAILFASLNRVAGAFFQARQKFALSLFLTIIHHWILVCAVPVVVLAQRPEALPAALTTLAGYLLMAFVGWKKALVQSRNDGRLETRQHTPLVEGALGMGAQLAFSALFQVDRLLIPKLLSINELANYSVVATLAASPFRMLQIGLGYSLLPRLRECRTHEAIQRLLRHEVRVALVIGAIAAIGVVLVTPWILVELLDNRYAFTPYLLAAFVIVGFVRLWDGIARAVVTALGSERDLFWLNACGWAALAVSIVSSFALAWAGLTGIVYGVGAGWLALALATTALGKRARASHVEGIVSAKAAPA
jgi:O-antigen/teichoic acid export membrane protein